ncbi:MAG TPA: haloalkane dehalogenase [Acidimicrobiales bacterium]|nr:haloalkane dehalogenase [Acidimicrobiales bacterium]
MEAIRTPDECFDRLEDYAFEANYATVGDGLRMHYVDVGRREAEPVLLLHGQPTWSYLYRHVIDGLHGAGYRVVAPDMIGYGRSDKPRRRTDYSLSSHIGHLGALIEALGLSGITVVVQDWGGPVGLGALAVRPGRFARIVATNTALHTADASLAGVLRWPCHQAADGTVVVAAELLDYQRLTQELERFTPSLFVQGATSVDLEPSVRAGYDAPYPDESFCAGARQLPLLMGLTPLSPSARRNRRALAALAAFGGPVLTAFSDGDPATAGWDTVLQRTAPGAAGRHHVVIRGAGHFVPEDEGAQLAQVIARFARDNPL